MVAGDKQKHLNNLTNLKCDIAMVNLEDGVFNKVLARDLVYKNLLNNDIKNKIVVRINSLDSCGKEDIKTINKIKPYAIRVPKIKTIEDVKECLKLIDKDIQIHLSIETKEALENLKTFKIDKRVTTVYLGILDLLESLGLSHSLLTFDNATIDYILSKFLIDAKTHSLYPVSFIYQEYQNLEQFELWCIKVKNMGYSAKACISPAQVDIINDIFKSNQDEIKKAKTIIQKFEEQQRQGISGFVCEKYGFIDEPIYKNAKLIVRNN
jgi:citrate lyase subunit beta/citryl-CoA lyase